MIRPSEVEQARSVIQQHLADSLAAVFLHGSAVTGGLRRDSDIDLLAVIEHPMTAQTRGDLAVELMKISGRHSPGPDDPRPLELIVFLRGDCFTSRYPARSEFVYGEWLRHEYEGGELPAPHSDPELTLVVAQARQEAKPLLGRPARLLRHRARRAGWGRAPEVA